MNYDFIKYSMPPGNFKYCFAFSVHKCGSTLMYSMIRQVCNKSGIPHVNIPSPMFEKGMGRKWKTDPDLLKLIVDGYIYYGFRDYPPIFKTGIDFTNTKNVLLVRDPRDALVSQYYSFKPGGSHILPGGVGEHNLKKQDVEISIDEYVLQFAQKLSNKLTDYQQALDMALTRLFRYEEIFFDKYSFINDIFSHFNLPVEDRILREVAKKNHIIPANEDPSKHIRRGIPGDYKNKLKPDTIDKLNHKLASIAKFYGYELMR